MTLFLKIVAGFVVALLLVGAMAYWFIRRKIKKFTARFGDMIEKVAEELSALSGVVPPFRMHLTVIEPDEDDSPFNDEEEMEQITEQFETLGFQPVADFACRDLPVRLRAWFHPENSLYGVAYEHDAAGIFCDVTRRYSDDTSWTASTSKYSGMASRPGAHPSYHPDATIEELVNKVMEDSAVNNILPVNREDFVKSFEAAYAREMNWHIERGGPTEQEIHKIAEINGQECTEEMVEAIQNQWKRSIADFLSEKALLMWKKENNLSGSQFLALQDRLLAVHGRMLPDQLITSVFPGVESDELLNDGDDDDPIITKARALHGKLNQWLSQDTIFNAFQRLLSSAGVAGKWEMQGTTDRPVAAQVWLMPADDDDDADEDFEPSEFDDELDM